MVFGIQNTTAITIDNLTTIGNANNIPEFATSINFWFNGWFYFWLMFAVWVVLYIKLQDKNNDPILNIMYSSAVLSLPAIFLRVIEISYLGVTQGLITDKQLWIFPLVTIVMATYIWMSKEKS